MSPAPAHWEYQFHPDHARVLLGETARVLEEIKDGKLDVPAALRDTRAIHARLFRKLTPKGRPEIAGNYRGDGKYPSLRNSVVKIQANPLVGAAPRMVRIELQKLGQVTDVLIAGLDKLHADQQLSSDDLAKRTVAAACRWFAQFLLIHPYVNGNGHIARIGLHAILARYGYFPHRFSIDPRPFGQKYSNAVRDYQQGDRAPLEAMVLSCLA